MDKNNPPEQENVAPLLLSVQGVMRSVKMSRSNIYASVKSCEFPPPVKIGKLSRWIPAELMAWVATRAAAREFVPSIQEPKPEILQSPADDDAVPRSRSKDQRAKHSHHEIGGPARGRSQSSGNGGV